MKIFISWSGTRSHKVAKLLDNWLQCVIQAVDPWLSSKDIDRGTLWFSEITNQLANTQNGIICLTKSNLNKPWILFEAGALAKGLNSSRVFTFLIDLKPNNVKDPLGQFNHTEPNKDSLYSLVRSINNGLKENCLKEEILASVFETYWPQFELEFKNIISETVSEDIPVETNENDLLSEVLSSVRNIDRRIRHIEVNEINQREISQRRIESNYVDGPRVRKLIDEMMRDGLSNEEIYKNLRGRAPSDYIIRKIDSARSNYETKLL
jgi:hypothetical protein